MKAMHNDFHGKGAGTGHVELLEMLPEVEAAWKAHKKEKRIRARNLPTKGDKSYRQVFGDWLKKNYPKTWKNAPCYHAARNLAKGLKKAGWFAEFSAMSDKYCDYGNPKVDPGVVLQACQLVFETLCQYYGRTIPREELKKIAMYCLRMCFPGAVPADVDGDDPLWLFDSHAKLKATKLLTCPMQGSVVYLGAAKKKAGVKRPKSKAKGSAGKGGGKGTSITGKKARKLARSLSDEAKGTKGKKDMKLEQRLLMNEKLEADVPLISISEVDDDDDALEISEVHECPEKSESLVCAGRVAEDSDLLSDDSGDHLLADTDFDLFAQETPEEKQARLDLEKSCAEGAEGAEGGGGGDPPTSRGKLILDDVFSSVSAVLEYIPARLRKQDAIKSYWEHALIFIVTGSARAPYEGNKSYSELRQALKEQLAIEHRGLAIQAGALQTLPSSIVNQVKRTAEERKEEMKTKLLDKAVVAVARQFKTENDLDMPIHLADVYRRCVTECFKKCKAGKVMNGDNFGKYDAIAVVHEYWLGDPFNPIFEKVCSPTADFVSEMPTGGFPEFLLPLFASIEESHAFCKVRTLLTVAVLANVFKSSDPSMVSCLENHIDDLAALDIHLVCQNPASDDECWQKAWASLVVNCEASKFRERIHQEIHNLNSRKSEREAAAETAEVQTALLGVPAASLAHDPLQGLKSLTNIYADIETVMEKLMEHDCKSEPPVLVHTPVVPVGCRLRFIEMTAKIIEARLFKTSLDKASPMCDSGHAEIHLNESYPGPSPIYAKNASRAIRLNFCGPVSPVASVGAMKVSECDGISFYVRPGFQAKSPVTSFILPAWLVPETSINEETGEPSEPASMKAALCELKPDIEFKERLLEQPKKFPITIHLPYLTISEQFLNKENVKLTRTAFDAEVTKVPDNIAAYKKQVAVRAKTLKEATTATTDKTFAAWQVVGKHLLT